MSLKDRETLKNYFKKGSMPKEAAFHHLIDSTVNKIDDTFHGEFDAESNQNQKRNVHVAGWITSKGRIGSYSMQSEVPADGAWHAITPKLNHCNAFEIVARTGIRGSGKQGILHAIAVSAYGTSRSTIRKTRSWYDVWRPVKLQLRWAGTTYNYQLELRCKQSLGKNVPIRFFITQLWSDEKMGYQGI